MYGLIKFLYILLLFNYVFANDDKNYYVRIFEKNSKSNCSLNCLYYNDINKFMCQQTIVNDNILTPISNNVISSKNLYVKTYCYNNTIRYFEIYENNLQTLQTYVNSDDCYNINYLPSLINNTFRYVCNEAYCFRLTADSDYGATSCHYYGRNPMSSVDEASWFGFVYMIFMFLFVFTIQACLAVITNKRKDDVMKTSTIEEKEHEVPVNYLMYSTDIVIDYTNNDGSYGDYTDNNNELYGDYTENKYDDTNDNEEQEVSEVHNVHNVVKVATKAFNALDDIDKKCGENASFLLKKMNDEEDNSLYFNINKDNVNAAGLLSYISHNQDGNWENFILNHKIAVTTSCSQNNIKVADLENDLIVNWNEFGARVADHDGSELYWFKIDLINYAIKLDDVCGRANARCDIQVSHDGEIWKYASRIDQPFMKRYYRSVCSEFYRYIRVSSNVDFTCFYIELFGVVKLLNNESQKIVNYNFDNLNNLKVSPYIEYSTSLQQILYTKEWCKKYNRIFLLGFDNSFTDESFLSAVRSCTRDARANEYLTGLFTLSTNFEAIRYFNITYLPTTLIFKPNNEVPEIIIGQQMTRIYNAITPKNEVAYYARRWIGTRNSIFVEISQEEDSCCGKCCVLSVWFLFYPLHYVFMIFMLGINNVIEVYSSKEFVRLSFYQELLTSMYHLSTWIHWSYWPILPFVFIITFLVGTILYPFWIYAQIRYMLNPPPFVYTTAGEPITYYKVDDIEQKCVTTYNPKHMTKAETMHSMHMINWTEVYLRVRGKSSLKYIQAAFLQYVQETCRVLINERYLPMNKRIFQPLDGFGFAGGEKYYHRECNCFFKFAYDDKGLYGNDDEGAIKASMNELRAMNAITAYVDQLILPLTAKVRLHGHCIIAVAGLPINQETLVYGSSDGGRSVRNEHKAAKAEIDLICESFHLKPHIVGSSDITLRSAGDVEIHNSNGDLFLLDLGRFFPPTTGEARKVWYHHFRPEAMKTAPWGFDLCADAFTSWGAHNIDEHNDEIKRARQYMIDYVIPQVASHIHINSDISSMMHNAGLNLRDLGYLLHNIGDPQVQLKVFGQMFCRGVLKRRFRRVSRTLVSTAEKNERIYSMVLVHYLNLILVPSSDSDLFFKYAINDLKNKYGHNHDSKYDDLLLKLLANYRLNIQNDPVILLDDIMSSGMSVRFNLPYMYNREDILKLIQFDEIPRLTWIDIEADVDDSQIIKSYQYVKKSDFIAGLLASILWFGLHSFWAGFQFYGSTFLETGHTIIGYGADYFASSFYIIFGLVFIILSNNELYNRILALNWILLIVSYLFIMTPTSIIFAIIMSYILYLHLIPYDAESAKNFKNCLEQVGLKPNFK